jgi:hypothetical protein
LLGCRRAAYDPRTARWLQRDPIDAASGDPNLYRYAGNDPINAKDPSGLDWLDDAANFFAGWGDTLTFGLTAKIRQWMGVDGVVDWCGGWYRAGGAIGILHTTVLGGSLGYVRNARLAGLSRADPARVFVYGRVRGVEKVEVSHWVPQRYRWVPKRLMNSPVNTKYMWASEHAKNDPFRFQFLPSWWKKANPAYPTWRQQLHRVPSAVSGSAAGMAAGWLSNWWNRLMFGEENVREELAYYPFQAGSHRASG